MKQVIHFETPEARLAYIKGQFEEIKPVKAKITPSEGIPEKAETEDKPKAKAKKGKKKDEVHA